LTSQTDKGNQGEEFIVKIAFKTFLKYWCYPNPKDENGDKKEICDLLILFNDTLLIICVKNYEFKGTYNRYFKKTINKDIRQVAGAERKLLESNRPIFIKHPDREPEEFKTSAIKNVFRIVVHLGENVRFYPLFGRTNRDSFVHIFDKDTFETILSELDTIPDFIEYLDKKEIAFKDTSAIILPKDEYNFDPIAGRQLQEYSFLKILDRKQKLILISGTEYDLLAHFLLHDRTMPEQISSEKLGWVVFIIDGAWGDFNRRKEVLLKKNRDKMSYFVDEFVKNELLIYPNEGRLKLAKELLSFSRFDRRVISKSFFTFYYSNKNRSSTSISRRYWKLDNVGFVFVLYPTNWLDLSINTILDLALKSFCIFDNYQAKKMILIANKADLKQFRFGYIDNIVQFNKKEEREIMKDVKKLGWFSDIDYSNDSEIEYPDN
jgi:hypothetical protein